MDPHDVETLVKLAWGLGRTGRLAEALRRAEQAVELDPNQWRAHHTIGQIHYQAGCYGEAISAYSAAVEIGPTDALLRCDLADALYSGGRFADAGAAYAEVLAAHPHDAYPHLWTGWSLLQVGEHAQAAAHFERALKLAPDWPEAAYALGRVCCAQGDFPRARQLLQEAVNGYPTEDEEARAAAACELGNAFRGLGDLKAAADLYRQALALDPTHPTARFNLALTYNDLGEFERAISELDIILQLEPEDVDALVERGAAHAALERPDDAMESYRAALGIDPDRAEAHGGLGLVYYMMALCDLSADHYARSAVLSPDDPWPQYDLGLALEAAGRHAEADTAFEQAVDKGGDDGEVCAAVARALMSQGRDPEAAIAAARRACGIDPGSAEALDALAMALYSAGRYDAALGPSQEATRLDPEAAEYRYDLGLIQEATEDVPGARESFTRALELAPDFEEARDGLRRLGDGF